MGKVLTDLADVCRSTGYSVIEVEGWQNRSRGGAGGAATDGYELDAPNHIIVHHTASGPNSDGWPDVNYMVYGHEDAPCGNLYISRDGSIYVMAGMASNTNGSGQDPCGMVADDNMNAKSIAIEAANDGVGEPWPTVQQNSYVKLVAALGSAYNIEPEQVHSHFEWAPGRKIDPAGQSEYASGADMWDMNEFRDDVARERPGPSPEPVPEPEGDDMSLLYVEVSDAYARFVGVGQANPLVLWQVGYSAEPRATIHRDNLPHVSVTKEQLRGCTLVGQLPPADDGGGPGGPWQASDFFEQVQ
jgi:hypothetical protein